MSSIRKSIGSSLASRTTYGFEEEPNYDEMTDDELAECLELSIRTNKILEIENQVFERYLARHDPQALVAMAQVLETAKQIQKVTSQLVPMSSSQNLSDSVSRIQSVREMKMPTSPSTITSVQTLQTFSASRQFAASLMPQAKGLRITLAHRMEMANEEIEEMKRHLTTVEQETLKKKANLRAQLEEIQIRIQEMKETKDQLEENVVKKGLDPLTGKIPAEKLVKFMEELIKSSDRIVEKLRLKSFTIKAQIKKATSQLQQREELGESLHPIDFQALAIENQQVLGQIEEKNQQLQELKTVTGRCNLELSSYKDKLAEQTAQLRDMKREMSVKKSQAEKLKSEEEHLKLEIEKIEKQIEHVKKLTDKYELPDVMEFIKVQTELREMKKTYSRLERHRQIQKTALVNLKKQQRQLHQNQPDFRYTNNIFKNIQDE